MSLTTVEIQYVVSRINPLIRGGKIVRIDQQDSSRYIFHVRKDSKRYWLLIVPHPFFSRLHLLTAPPRPCRTSKGFCNVLRQHLTGVTLDLIEVAGDDRVAVCRLTGRDALLRERPLKLVAELFGNRSNLILIDDGGAVLGMHRSQGSAKRKLYPGMLYELPEPPRPQERALENRFAAYSDSDRSLDLSRAVGDYYEQAEEQALFSDKFRKLQRRLEIKSRQLARLRVNLLKDLKEARNADKYRKDAELLKIAMKDIQKGQKSVKTLDFFSDGSSERVIELDPRLSPQKYADRLFERYKRLKKSIQPLHQKLNDVDRQRKELENIAVSLDNIKSLRELAAFENSPEVKGVLPGGKRPSAGRPELAKRGPRSFLSSDGYRILVARNRRENHSLTFSTAGGRDCWMHVLGWPGAHVIIKCRQTEVPPYETLLDAAHLAIYYSKFKGSGSARVVYTRCKHVKPVKNGKYGEVHYACESTLNVRCSKIRLHKLFESSDCAAGA